MLLKKIKTCTKKIKTCTNAILTLLPICLHLLKTKCIGFVALLSFFLFFASPI